MRVGNIDLKVFGKQLLNQVFVEDDIVGLSAELAYRFFLALFPFFIFLGAMGGFIASWLNVQNPARMLVDMMGDALPPQAAQVVQDQLQQVVGQQSAGVLSLGILGALFFATGGMNSIIKAMNRAYDVPETRPFWRRYLTALGITVLAGAFILSGFVLWIVAQVWGSGIAQALGLEGAYGTMLRYGLWPAAFLMVLIAVAFIYWKTPNMDQNLKWISPGAIVFLIGWIVATGVFGYYVANFGSYASTYGALGGVAVLMIWFYITAFVLLVGAEVNAIVDEKSDPARVGQAREEKRQEAERKTGKTERRESGEAGDTQSERAA